MRDAAIVEIGIRETATFCEFADFAYSNINASGEQDTAQTFFHIHAFLGHCAVVARLVWSEAFAQHANGQSLAQVLDVPADYRSHQDGIRELVDAYDRRLAHAQDAAAHQICYRSKGRCAGRSPIGWHHGRQTHR